MTKLSVNINKFATLRNSRGGNNPDVVKAAIDAQEFGADGVTVHPRPDERHIRYSDVYAIKKIITTEKDAQRILSEELMPLRMAMDIYYLPIRAAIPPGDEERFNTMIYNYVQSKNS